MLGQTKDYIIGICCFCAKNTTLTSKIKDWLVQNQDNVKGCFLFTANRVIIQLYHGKNKIHFNEMMMMSALYQTNILR
jgi:hypothetical protein